MTGSSSGLITATIARQDLDLCYLKAQSSNQQHQQHVGVCQKYKHRGPTTDLLI